MDRQPAWRAGDTPPRSTAWRLHRRVLLLLLLARASCMDRRADDGPREQSVCTVGAVSKPDWPQVSLASLARSCSRVVAPSEAAPGCWSQFVQPAPWPGTKSPCSATPLPAIDDLLGCGCPHKAPRTYSAAHHCWLHNPSARAEASRGCTLRLKGRPAPAISHRTVASSRALHPALCACSIRGHKPCVQTWKCLKSREAAGSLECMHMPSIQGRHALTGGERGFSLWMLDWCKCWRQR